MALPPDRSIRELLDSATRRLAPESPRLDAEVLLAACLGKPRSYLHAWPERAVPPAQCRQFLDWIQRRATGVPVAHLTGQREFWSLELAVSPATLIPRPETETLVALALARIPADRPVAVADLGTGCGAIALAIARERPLAELTATDISDAALGIAGGNARRLGIHNVRFARGAWCAALPVRRQDCILSNPPYVADADPHLEAGDVRFEPRDALVAGPQGLDALRNIVPCARDHLLAGGWLLVEHGHDQGDAVVRLFRESGYREIRDHTDDAGVSRVTTGQV